MMVQEPVQAAIWHCLNNYDEKNAVFLAERLCAEVETDDTIHILATSYYRANLLHQAYWLLREKSRRSAQCRFLLAKVAYKLKKYAEAESSISYIGFGDPKCLDEIVKDFGNIACFAFQLIALICIKTERTKLAVEALKRALKLNPFMWHAFAMLCHMGEPVDPATVFQITGTEIFKTCQGTVNTNALIVFGSSSGATPAGVQDENSISLIPPGTVASSEGNFSVNLNNSYLLSTPLDCQSQMPMPVLGGLVTPNNNNFNNNNNSTTTSLNNSISMLRGGGGGGGGGGVVGNLNNTFISLDETPSGVPLADNGAGTPHRKQFKYLLALSPPTPSFGILPLSSPLPEVDSSLIEGSTIAAQQVSVITPNPSVMSNVSNSGNVVASPQTLVEVNQEPKLVVNKKMKSGAITGGGGGGTFLNRKESSTKPAVFTQTGNITPRTPNNPINMPSVAPTPNVRRSTRLFSNNAASVKENNKSPSITGKFAQPRSPPRKTKSRMPKICINNELIDEKSSHNTEKSSTNERNSRHAKPEKVKVETITSSSGGSITSGTGTLSSRSSSEETSKVLLNNSLNSAQTIAHHILALKKQSADGLMALLRELGEAYKNLTFHKCKDIVKQLEATVPKHHLCSSWVQSIIGLVHYEMREYDAAVSVFRRVHEQDPHRLQYMEMYSSSLWHLQREVELSALAQDLMNQDKMSPVTWCVAGNCFSLHKEHETAIKFFKRAVQVDPEFVYSYTLLGHELVLTEELDKALDFFRAAIVRDPRHYNAWFGMGTIYSKQEKYELAELHFLKALKINPQNSVIMVHIGAMQYFMNKKQQALQTLNAAAKLDPKNPLARFHRGSIYFSLGRHDDALRELEELKEVVPKESVVFYLIGKIHKTLGNVDSALMHFSWATDLDPKGANNQMKDAFDTMSHPQCCPAVNDQSLDTDNEPSSERSDESLSQQVPQELNYDSDHY